MARHDRTGYQTVRYGDHRDQLMHRWDPVGDPVGSAVLLHGGYWRHRYGLDLMDPLAGHLADRGWLAWNVEYRRVEESALEADGGVADGGVADGGVADGGVVDGGAGGRADGVWDRMSADVLVALSLVDAAPVVVIGHSAGGHLALWAAAESSVPAAVVALAPVTDLEEADRLGLSEGAVRELLGGGRAAIPNRYAAASPIRRLPLGVPQLVVHGPSDQHVPFELAASYAEAARSAGDSVELHDPVGIDHFDVIDPSHPVWRTIDSWLARLP
jgi:acetyl esterase/lipase